MRLSVTTPRGALVDTNVEELTAPGLLGEFGVLPGHVPLMSALKPGVLTYRAADHSGTLAVGEGFLQVAPSGPSGEDRVLVLVDQATNATAVDRAAAEKELVKLEGELSAWKAELDGTYKALCVRRDWAQAQLNAAARLNPS
ncbi:MAG TPA: ATP synthase F1 subunit epsilon [Polyangia bacterium]|nr:ATP synthase F1 subunit epsilon [Polyangia bacterium]